MQITLIDWAIIVVFTAGLMLLGHYTRGFAKGVADFTIAGRKLKMWLGLSASSAEGMAIASIVMLGQEGFLRGFGYMWLAIISMMICVPLIGIYGFGIKRYRATGVHTLPQYYEMRYSRGVRILAGIAISLGGVLNMAIFPIVAAQFLTTFLGLPETVQIAGVNIATSYIIMFFAIGLPLFFVLKGGFVTVVITNYLQSIIMAAAVLLITFLSFRRVGGGLSVGEIIDKMHTALNANLGQSAFSPFTSGYGITWLLFFIAMNIYGTLAFPPSLVMTSGAETPEVARKMYLIRIIYNWSRFVCILTWGIAAMAVIGTAVPEGANRELYQRMATPMFLKTIVPPGLLGIAVAGFLFAEVATVSGYLLSWSSVIVNDVVCSVRKTPLSTKQHIRALRITFISVAAFLFMWGVYYKPSESVLTYLYLTGSIFTGAGIISFHGLYWKRTTTLAAYLTLIICMVVPLADVILKQHWDKIAILKNWKDSYPLRGEQSGLMAIVASMAIIYVLSIFAKKQNFVDYGEKIRELESENKS